jgi:glutathione synthase/RimK-type ligase-like ATP-grasp enzyme
MSAPSVLVISTAIDESTSAVVDHLRERDVQVIRLDTEQFPFSTELSATLGESLLLDWTQTNQAPMPSSVWYRRVRSPAPPVDMNSGVYDFCVRESRSTLLGMLLASDARFMSPPSAVWAAENKVYQLAVARKLGIPIPKTLVTNSPTAIRSAFARLNGRMVIKPAKSGYVDFGPEQHAIYTNRFLEEHLERVEAARLCPAIYQELLEKSCDVRVTLVGHQVFVAEIDSQSDPAAITDWRHTSNPNLPHRSGELPGEIIDGLFRLLDALNLSFGAVDLVRMKDGSYRFLEINPNGQWLWLEDQLGFPIAVTVADWLSKS